MQNLIQQGKLITDASELKESARYIFVTSEDKLIGAGPKTTDYLRGVFNGPAQPNTKFSIQKKPEQDAIKLVGDLFPSSHICVFGEGHPLISEVKGDVNWSLFQLVFTNGLVSIKSTHAGAGDICFVQITGEFRIARIAASVPDDKWGRFRMYEV